MKKDAEEIRLEKIAKQKLLISKELRLIGADGYIHLPAVPDMFYLNELVVWLRNAIEENKDFMITSDDYKFDNTILSVGYSKIIKTPSAIENLTLGVHALTKAGNIKQVELYQSLSDKQLSRFELRGDEYLKHSFSHHRFLERIFNTLHNQSGTFVTLLAEKIGAPIRSQDEMYEDALKALRWLQSSLLNIEVAGSFRIPDLYALRDHGVLMSYSLNEVFQFECEEWGLLYTYRFSKETSYHFLMGIKHFLVRLINRYEALEVQQRKQPSQAMALEKTDGELIRKPTLTKDKVKLILELLGSRNEAKNEKEDMREPKKGELSITAVMILLRVFIKFKVFNQNVEKWRLGIAYHILTSYSYSKFDKLFKPGEINEVTLREMSDSNTLSKAKKATESIEVKLKAEILPFLEEIKDL